MALSNRERILRARLEFLADVSDAKALKAELQRIDAMLQRAKARSDGLRRLRERFAELNIVARRLALTGAAITGGLTALATTYVKEVGSAEEASRRWQQTQERLHETNVRLGRAAATALLPTLEKLAEIAERAAQFAERNPQLVRLAVNAGAALAVAGSLAVAIGEAARISVSLARSALDLTTAIRAASAAAQIKGQGALAGARGAALAGGFSGVPLSTGGVGALSLGALGAITAVGTALGAAAIAVIAKERGQTFGETLGQSLTAGFQVLKLALIAAITPIYLLAKAVIAITGIFEEAAVRIRQIFEPGFGPRDAEAALGEIRGRKGAQQEALNQQFANIVGFIADLGKPRAAEAAVQEAIEPITDQMVDQFEDFMQAQADAEFQFQRQRAMLITQFNDETLQLEADYQRRRQQQIDDFQKRQARARGQFLQRLMEQDADHRDRIADMQADADENAQKAEDDFNREYNRRESDFQRDRLRQLEEHEQRLKEAAGRLDAVAVLNEMQRFNRQQSQRDDDFKKEQKRREQDFDRQQKAQRKALKDQIKDAQDAYQKQRDRQLEHFEEQAAIAVMDFEEQLARQDEEHQIQMDRRDQEFRDRLHQMDEQHRFEMQLRASQFADRLRQEIAENTRTEIETQRHYASMRSLLANFIGSTMTAAQVQAQELAQRTLQQFGGQFISTPTGSQQLILPAGTGASISQAERAAILQSLAVTQGFQHGGRVPRDMMAALHGGEQVLTARTAGALRGMMGGGINENRLLAAISGARGDLNVGGMSFSGVEGADDIQRAVRVALSQVLEGV